MKKDEALQESDKFEMPDELKYREHTIEGANTRLTKHLDRYNDLYIYNPFMYEEREGSDGKPVISSCDIDMLLWQSPKVRLYNIVLAFKCFWKYLSLMSIRYPYGGTEEDVEMFKDLRKEGEEPMLISVIHDSWWQHIKDAFGSFPWFLKFLFRKFTWSPWVYTIDTTQPHNYPGKEDGKEEEEFEWVFQCGKPWIYNNKEIVKYTKQYIKSRYKKTPKIKNFEDKNKLTY